MQDYLIKKLKHQELGYSNKDSDEPGTSRGQYFLISKKYLNFFPPLSKDISQDLQILNIVSHEQVLPVQAKYIYDNDKFHGSKANSPRNEHRININLKINPEKKIFLKEDIIVFKKERFTNEDNDGEDAFIITRFRKSENETDYKRVEEIIEKNKINTRSQNYSYASIEDFVKVESYNKRLTERVMSLNPLIPETDKSLLFQNMKSSYQKADGELRSLEKQIKRLVFDRYDYKCIVTGIGYKWRELGEVKNSWRGITGAHIKPRAHEGPYDGSNIVPLLEPIHQLFDKGIFTITADLHIKIHENALKDDLLENFHAFNNKKLIVPQGIELSEEYIEYHRNNIFGYFLEGKQIRSLKTAK